MCKFPKYSLRFLILRNLSEAFIDDSDRAWSLTFSIQVCMNCLNSFLEECRIAGTRVRVGTGARVEAGLRVRV